MMESELVRFKGNEGGNTDEAAKNGEYTPVDESDQPAEQASTSDVSIVQVRDHD